MKHFSIFKQIIFVFFISLPSYSFSQIIFGELADTVITLPFLSDGMEFINNDIWMVDGDELVQMRFPIIKDLNRFSIPQGGPPISDITSDGSQYIWLAEGRGSPNGKLHTFDLNTGSFISESKLNGIDDYQIQGIDYYSGELWITNWDGEKGNILITDTDGNFKRSLLFNGDVILPISVYGDAIISGGKDFLFAYEKNGLGLLDFKHLIGYSWVSGPGDIYDNKFWFTIRGLYSTDIYSIDLNGTVSTTIEETVHSDVQMSLFPNPSSDYIQLEAQLDISDYRATIIDTKGQVYRKSISNINQIDISDLLAQSYFLILESEGENPICIKFTKI